MAQLEIRGLAKSFGGVRAVDGLDLDVAEGQIVSLIGPNGAGKTTVFDLITGLATPEQGSIRFAGESIVGRRPSQIVALGVSRTFQAIRLFPEMTVRENVMVARSCRTRSGLLRAILRTPSFRREEAETASRAEGILARFGDRLTGDRHDMPARSLSYANQRRLEVARALASEPRLVLLDEPTAGMNPHETLEMTSLIGRLRDELGVSVVLIEHAMEVVEGISERVVVLDFGRKIAEGSFDEIAADDQVVEAYLGRGRRRGHGRKAAGEP